MDSATEWTAACEVQQRFMPRMDRLMDAVDVSAQCRQMQELGGDFYDLAPHSDHRLAVAIGDASGKGLPAALMISNVQSSLRTAALFTACNAAAMDAVNRQVYESSLAERYATLFYGVYDRDAGILRYVNAGHHPPMVMGRDGSITWLETGGAPVGTFPDLRYDEGTVELKPGETVLAYTDGVIEAANPAGEEWGIEGLTRAALAIGAGSAGEIVQAVFRAMDRFSHRGQTDDATLVALRAH